MRTKAIMILKTNNQLGGQEYEQYNYRQAQFISL